MEKGFFPYLYQGENVPDILGRYAQHLLNEGSEIEQLKAERIFDFRSQIIDRGFLGRIRNLFYGLYDEIDQKLPELSFKLIGRRKSLFSAINKLEELESTLDPGKLEEYIEDNPFKSVVDFFAFRIIIFDDINEGSEYLEALSDVITLVKNFFKRNNVRLIKVKNYIKLPKENGYKSYHMILRDQVTGHRFEIQIRTITMHEEAENGNANWLMYKNESYASQLQETSEYLDLSKIQLKGFRYRAVPRQVQRKYVDKTGVVHTYMDEYLDEKYIDFEGIIDAVTIIERQKTFPYENDERFYRTTNPILQQ